MPRNIYQNLFSPSFYNLRFSTRPLVLIHHFKMGLAKRKNRHLLEIARALLLQMHVPKHFWADVVSIACFLINRMSSLVLNWSTSCRKLFPNNPLFPDAHALFEMSVLKSLNLIRNP